MNHRLATILFFGPAILFLGGCGIIVVPKPTANAILNPNDNSLLQSKGNVVISARVQDLEVAPYGMVNNITSFYLTIRNKSDQPTLIPLDSYLLVDSRGEQYRSIPPAEIQGIVRRDSEYLIPYPYVGFYYLEDSEKYGFSNTFNSALPYYAENHPQDIFTRALPIDSILPGNLITGEIYFLIDLALKEAVDLRVYLPGTQVTGPPDYQFSFAIEK
jgi:hypothetical protein